MQPPLKRDVNAMELLEWALEAGEGNSPAALITGAAVPTSIRRCALDLLSMHQLSPGLGDLAEAKNHKKQ